MTDKKYIIALDQGTTSSRAVLLDHMRMWLKLHNVNLPKSTLELVG
ncbi:glycerol kinase [Haemophilus influenzae]|nr:Glycerol kinase [Haemophilus influenzae]PRI84258.1 Glycerol kinase [Haemophilus influenzae]PRI91949.1 Glycerol kinase [Haemophilus influenzae]PRI93583.1 Glycerol kinase [Haemophilus influenzae]PRL92097.1 Glycerol kinase [Haemophilus influenzae]